MPWTTMVPSLAIAVLLAACATPFQQQERVLGQPTQINCATSEGDIRMLQHGKSRVAQQVATGIIAIAQAGTVMGVLMGTEQTKLQVATGDYNRMIDQKLADSKMTCGLP